MLEDALSELRGGLIVDLAGGGQDDDIIVAVAAIRHRIVGDIEKAHSAPPMSELLKTFHIARCRPYGTNPVAHPRPGRQEWTLVLRHLVNLMAGSSAAAGIGSGTTSGGVLLGIFPHCAQPRRLRRADRLTDGVTVRD